MKWSHLKMHFKTKVAAGSTDAHSIPFASQTVFDASELGDWYDPVMLGPATVATLAVSPTYLKQVIQIVERLEPDDYSRYLLAYYQAGLERFVDAWRYADILTVLIAAAKLVSPANYLEIGVRRGRGMAIVAAISPDCNIVGFDLWATDYAGMPNPGPEFVRSEIEKLGHVGHLELITGNSHESLPQYFSSNPDLFFDLITVDGDHSKQGAKQDLRDVLPRIKIGGVLVFDDICHPKHSYLAEVWDKVVVQDTRFTTWQYTDLGYGVAFAIRKKA